MKALHLAVVSAAMPALMLPAGKADAGGVAGLSNMQVSPPRVPHGHMHSFGHGFGGGFFIVEPEVVHDVVVVHDAPADPPPPPAPPPPRKPFVLGRTYSSLPGGCMKMIDRGVSFYQCSGEWYRQVSGGRDGFYLAVAHP